MQAYGRRGRLRDSTYFNQGHHALYEAVRRRFNRMTDQLMGNDRMNNVVAYRRTASYLTESRESRQASPPMSHTLHVVCPPLRQDQSRTALRPRRRRPMWNMPSAVVRGTADIARYPQRMS